jgi:uncharacterized protein YkuJ
MFLGVLGCSWDVRRSEHLSGKGQDETESNGTKNKNIERKGVRSIAVKFQRLEKAPMNLRNTSEVSSPSSRERMN